MARGAIAPLALGVIFGTFKFLCVCYCFSLWTCVCEQIRSEEQQLFSQNINQ